MTLVTSANFLKSYVCSDVTYIFRAREAKLQTATWNAKKKGQESDNFYFFPVSIKLPYKPVTLSDIKNFQFYL